MYARTEQNVGAGSRETVFQYIDSSIERALHLKDLCEQAVSIWCRGFSITRAHGYALRLVHLPALEAGVGERSQCRCVVHFPLDDLTEVCTGFGEAPHGHACSSELLARIGVIRRV